MNKSQEKLERLMHEWAITDAINEGRQFCYHVTDVRKRYSLWAR